MDCCAAREEEGGRGERIYYKRKFKIRHKTGEVLGIETQHLTLIDKSSELESKRGI